MKKIASVFARTRPICCTRYYDKELDPDTLRADRGYGRNSGNCNRMPRYGASTFVLLEYLGAGIDKGLESKGYRLSWRDEREEKPKQGRYRFMRVLQKSGGNSDNAVKRMCLMRIRESYLVNLEHEPLDTEFGRVVGMPLEKLATTLAAALHEKMVVHLYHKCHGLPTQERVKFPFPAFHCREKPEDYENPGSAPLDPKVLIAANAFYPHVEGLEARIRRAKKTFDLILLAGIRIFQERIADEELAQSIQNAVEGALNMKRVFYSSLAYYHIAAAEGKLKCQGQ